MFLIASVMLWPLYVASVCDVVLLQCTFLEPLLSHNPGERPDTKDIRSHSLLADFEEARVAVKRLRSISTSSRLHTNSSSSSTSADKDHS